MNILKTLIGTAAPALAAALGAPALALDAVKFLSSRILGKPDGTAEEVAQMVQEWSPEQRLELTRLDHDYNLAMLQQGINVFELEIKDRQGAREMAVAAKNMWPQMILAIIYNLGFFGVLWALIASMGNVLQINASIKDTLIFLLGVMASELKNVNAFWVGSSYGSKEKNDQQFAALMQQNARA
ncbi:MAG: hypothetical protein HGB00_08395 [Chlorobiaceae bacterium]|nr:hypothetical protein [Chlorobiaceae bacterium]